MVLTIFNTVSPKNFSKASGYVVAPGTYTYIFQSLATPADQFITIPTNISGSINVKCWGAGGGTVGRGNSTNNVRKTGRGGGGGYAEANFNTANLAGKKLTIIVGEGGKTKDYGTILQATYGGGGDTSTNFNDTNFGNASGGGRSAVRLPSLPSDIEIITAGGGGGGGGVVDTAASVGVCSGGAGGGPSGADSENSLSNTAVSNNYKGGGGSQTAGGAKGLGAVNVFNTAGSQYNGGTGSVYTPGGGGGWYGGGGGGSTTSSGGSNKWFFSGSGGGSGHIDTTYGTEVYNLQGSGNLVAGTAYLPSGYTAANVGSGGVPPSSDATSSGSVGQNGLVVISFTAV